MSPLRRTVTSRSPSCVGSLVYATGSARDGFPRPPNFTLMFGSSVAGSNRPATISTALSGWYQVL